MSKRVMKDSWLDSAPAWLALVLMGILPVLFWATGWTWYGQEAKETGAFMIALGFLFLGAFAYLVFRAASSKDEVRTGHFLLMFVAILLEWAAFVSFGSGWYGYQ